MLASERQSALRRAERCDRGRKCWRRDGAQCRRGGVSFGRARGLLYFWGRGLLPRSRKSLPCRKLSEGRKLAMGQDILVGPQKAAPHTDQSLTHDFQLGKESLTYREL